MANSGRFWKEVEIQQVKDFINSNTDYSSLFNSLWSGLKSNLSADETSLSTIPTLVGTALAIITSVGAIVSVPLLLMIIDTAIDIDSTYEDYKDRWKRDPDNTNWYTEAEKRKNNILIGDALCFGSSVGKFIERNSDGSYDFYSLFKSQFLNKLLGRALNLNCSYLDRVVETFDNGESYDFRKINKFHPINHPEIPLYLSDEMKILLNIDMRRSE